MSKAIKELTKEMYTVELCKDDTGLYISFVGCGEVIASELHHGKFSKNITQIHGEKIAAPNYQMARTMLKQRINELNEN